MIFLLPVGSWSQKKKHNMYFVYILSCIDGSLYTGITVDLDRRVQEHNEGKIGAKYTKSRTPVTLVYSKKMKNKSTALKEEYRIKQLDRNEKIKLTNEN